MIFPALSPTNMQPVKYAPNPNVPEVWRNQHSAIRYHTDLSTPTISPLTWRRFSVFLFICL